MYEWIYPGEKCFSLFFAGCVCLCAFFLLCSYVIIEVALCFVLSHYKVSSQMRLCTHSHSHTFTYIKLYLYRHMHTYTHTHLFIYKSIFTHTHTHTNIDTYIFIFLYTYKYHRTYSSRSIWSVRKENHHQQTPCMCIYLQ